MSFLPPVVPQRAAERDLARRLDALAELAKIGKARAGLDGVSEALISDSEALLRRAGERLRLSGSHTVVALAGGTGSGKSTLFNALAGAPFSQPGVTRPTTRHVHACVWGVQGAGPLLDWLGVQRRHRFARASPLDSGEAAMTGLLLLDLPDHDSVVTASMAAVDRLTKLTDMLVFVLDPQKYADASVHYRYLIPLAGHASLITVVLNQMDLLSPGQVQDCEQDLRRLLDAEGLHDTQVLPVSARTGAGLDALRAVLTEAVAARHAASERISADIGSLVGGFAIHTSAQIAPERAVASLLPSPPAAAGKGGNGSSGGGAPGTAAWTTAGGATTSSGRGPAAIGAAAGGPAGSGPVALGASAGGVALTEPLAGPTTQGKAPWDAPDWDDSQLLGAPVVVTRPPWEDATPEGSPRTGAGTDPVAFVPEGPADVLVEALAQAAGVAAMAEAMASAREAQAVRFTGWPVARVLRRRRDPVRHLRGAGLPGGALFGAAQQSEVDNAITRFTDAIGAQLPTPWGRSLREAARSGAPQVPGALATSVRGRTLARGVVPAWWRLIAAWQWLLAGLAVAGVAWSAVIAVGRGASEHAALLSDVSLIPWLLVMAVATALLGWLTASGCHNMVLAAAEHEQSQAASDMHEQVVTVARDLVLAPAGREIAEYERYRIALDEARPPYIAAQ